MSGFTDIVIAWGNKILWSLGSLAIFAGKQVFPTRKGSCFWASSNEGAQKWALVSLAKAHPLVPIGQFSGLLPLHSGKNQALTRFDQGFRGSAPALLRRVRGLCFIYNTPTVLFVFYLVYTTRASVFRVLSHLVSISSRVLPPIQARFNLTHKLYNFLISQLFILLSRLP
jgi:hypothetical protein